MSPNTSINPAANSVASIVGTPPTAQRSAGDGSAPAESFATALSQASSPPPPAPAPAPGTARDDAGADPTQGGSAHAGKQPACSDPTNAVRNAAQRKAASARADGTDGPGSAPKPAPGAKVGRPCIDPLDLPAQDADAKEPVDKTPGAAGLLAALAAATPAITERSAGKAGAQAAGGLGGAAGAARAGAAVAGNGAGAATANATRRGDVGFEADAAAADRDTALRASPSLAPNAPAGAQALPATTAPLHTPATLSAAAANGSAGLLAEARLPASPGSAEFAPALGAQINVFLREGIQHARLQLHPAELGPLTVQIQLDGATAQVQLAAEHPLTRQALEQAMPTLAGTLRESGLTLTGGGVFEQAPNPQAQQDPRTSDSDRSTGSRRDRDTDTQTNAAPLRALPARRGVVDLVA